jgi:hypothetical protein
MDPETAESVEAAIKWILESSSLCKPQEDGHDDDLFEMLAIAAQTLMERTANMVVYTADRTVDAAETVAKAIAHVALVYSSVSVEDIHRRAAAAKQNLASSSSKKVHRQSTAVQAC